LLHLEQFFAILKRYWFLGPIGMPVGAVVVVLELASGFGLLLQSVRRISAFVGALTLLFVTIGAILQYFGGASDTPCGCWFTLPEPGLSILHFVSNLVIVVLLFGLGLVHAQPSIHHDVQPQKEVQQ